MELLIYNEKSKGAPNILLKIVVLHLEQIRIGSLID